MVDSVAVDLTCLRIQLLEVADAIDNASAAETLRMIADAMGQVSWFAAVRDIELGGQPILAPMLPSLLLHMRHPTLQ